MDIQTITSFIGSVGFPIVMCIMIYKQMIDEGEKHREEMLSLRDAIHSLEMMISKLCEKIDKDKGE